MATPPKQVEIELSFPLQGKVEEVAYSKQPPQTYVDGLNVVPFDTLEDRSRGGQRWGVSKYDDIVINGTNFIQRIDNTVRAVGVLEAAPGTNLEGSPFTFDQVEGTKAHSGTSWHEYSPLLPESGFDYPLDLGEHFTGGSSERAFEHTGTDQLRFDGDVPGTGISSGRILASVAGGRRAGSNVALDADHIDFVQRIRITTGSAFDTTNNAQYFMGIFYRGRFPAGIGGNDPNNEYLAILWHREVGGGQRLILMDETNTVLQAQTSGPMTAAPDNGEHILEMRVVGTQLTVLWDSVFAFSRDISGDAHDSVTGTIEENAFVGIMYVRQRDAGAWAAGNAEGLFGVWEIFSGDVIAGDVERNVIVVSGGNVFSGRPSLDGFTLVPGGTGALQSASFGVDSVFAFNNLFLVDGRNYQRFDQATSSVAAWDATAGTLPGGQGSAAAADDVPRCRIIQIHQGSVYLSGKEDDPTNLFRSAIDDAFNWDFTAPAAGGGGAIDFGSLSNIGVPGDIITAIIPHINQRLIVGTDNSIHQITGNPADTTGPNPGRRIAISRGIGIVGAQAWTISPDQSIYFMADDGIYRLAANEFDVDKNNKISTGRIDRTIRSIDQRIHKIHLEWSREFDGLFIFVTPTLQGPTTHFFWDRKSASFHPFQFPDNLGPTSVLSLENAAPIDAGFILGGFDSFLRKLDKAANQDDGTAISSSVLIGPILSPFAGREIRISNMRAILDEQSGPVTFEIRAADTPEQAVTATPVFSGTWTAGRNAPSWDRARGAAIYLRLSQSTLGQTWSMESVTARITEAGPTRPR